MADEVEPIESSSGEEENEDSNRPEPEESEEESDGSQDGSEDSPEEVNEVHFAQEPGESEAEGTDPEERQW